MIHGSPHNGQRPLFPRPLTSFERASLLWLLPEERSGYKGYHKYVTSWMVAGEGRRGSGNFILAEPGIVPDVESPLPQVFAYGVIETDGGDISVTLRELCEGQLEFEIVSLQGDEIPAQFVEKRRWNFSSWSAGEACPVCGAKAREVTIRRESGENAVLAVCVRDKRLWIFDERDGVNHLIPVTNFHNALMLHKNIRDPKKALVPENFFSQLHEF